MSLKSDIDSAKRRLHNLLADEESRLRAGGFFDALAKELIHGSSFVAVTAREAGRIEIEIKTPEDVFYDPAEEEI